MAGADTVRAWLVERSYSNDSDIVTLVYATPDGRKQLTKQLSMQLLRRTDVTAAADVPAEKLDDVHESDREQYATEAKRMAAANDPDDTV